MPVPSAGKATVARPSSRTRSIALRVARSMAASFVRRPRSIDTAWMTTSPARWPAGVTTASPTSTGAWRRRRELDLVPADALDLAGDARRHPQRRGCRTHDRVDLEVTDVAVPELDACHSALRPASVRTSMGEPAAWYTRGSRLDIEVTTSYVIVPVAAARSIAAIRSDPWAPSRTNSSPSWTRSPGTSVTSAITASMATRPTSGTRVPRTSAEARSERFRCQPSP